MDLSVYRDTHLCLTFYEAVIIWENRGLSRAAMLSRLKDLQQNTKDPMLKASISSLLWKLAQTDEKDYARLSSAAERGDLLFPGNYTLTQKE